jgi:hypothetical protein
MNRIEERKEQPGNYYVYNEAGVLISTIEVSSINNQDTFFQWHTTYVCNYQRFAYSPAGLSEAKEYARNLPG